MQRAGVGPKRCRFRPSLPRERGRLCRTVERRTSQSLRVDSWSAISVLYFQVIVRTRRALCGWGLEFHRNARRAYEAVRDAQQAAIDAVRPGIAVGEVDAAARKVLRKAGLGRYFTHSTGHGVGLEIHESPRVGDGQKEILQPGMVITIEPGVYFPGKWGVRIEDMVAVNAGGCEVMTPTSKDFLAV